MKFDSEQLRCACPAGTALNAAGNCSVCASGFTSASGVCLSGCYELGTQFYYEGGDDGENAAGKVCLECSGVI